MIERSPLVILIIALSILGSSPEGAEAQDRGSVAGIVKLASGEKAAGAYVKAKNAERRLTYMVISGDQGQFRMPNLPAGKYTLHGIGGGFESAVSLVEVAAGTEMPSDLSLNQQQQGRPKPMTSGEVESFLPEAPGKTILKSKCTVCHELGRVVRFRGADRDDWQGVVEEMGGYAARMPGALMSEQEATALIDYLVGNLGPAAAPLSYPDAVQSSHLPKNLLTGVAAKYMVVDFAVPTGSHPHDVSVDSQGNAWVSERRTGHIGRFDPRTLAYTRIPLPAAESTRFGLNGIAVDGNDRVWVIDGGPNNRLMRYDPKAQQFTTFEVPAPGAVMNTIRFLSDGTVWGTRHSVNQIARLDPASGEFKLYPVPTGVREKRSAGPYGMAVDGNAKIWFAENAFNKVGKLDPGTGEISEFVLPLPQDVEPKRMGTDRDGNVWMGVYRSNNLVKIDHRTDQFTLFTPPTADSGPYSVSVDTSKNLIWFSEHRADKLARFDPRTNTFVEYSLPTLNSDVRRIEVDPSRPNRIWFSGSGASYHKVGYLEVIE